MEPTKLAQQIINHLAMLRNSASSNSLTKERQWIIERLNSPALQRTVSESSILSLHILSALENGEATGIELASHLNVTRGGVTRATKKLVQAALITASKHPNDAKKIFYCLTADGKTVAAVHDQLHDHLTQRFETTLISQYSHEELTIINRFLADVIQQEQ